MRPPLLLPSLLSTRSTRGLLIQSLKQSTKHLNHQLLEPIIIMGLGEDIKEFGEGEMQQQGGNNGNDNNSSGGISDSTKDTMADSAVDSFASKEGVPSQLDSGINNVVNDEVNKF